MEIDQVASPAVHSNQLSWGEPSQPRESPFQDASNPNLDQNGIPQDQNQMNDSQGGQDEEGHDGEEGGKRRTFELLRGEPSKPSKSEEE